MRPISRTAALRSVRALLLGAALLLPALAAAQVRERPVPFDSAGKVTTVTPPLAARLGLDTRTWPVSGDFLDARLYAVGDPAEAYVIVVRRQRDAVDRYPLSTAQRGELAGAIARGSAAMRASGIVDTLPTVISEPVRGQFVFNQTLLGLTLFGPAASALVGDAAAAGATYLLVAGGSFFYSTALTQHTPVTRAQNHLASHSAFRGAVAGNLALIALGGNHLDAQAYAGATLVGGIAGDVIGFNIARPMTDAEAHGTSHGSTVTAVLTAGTLGTLGAYNSEAGGRLAAAGILTAGALGYPVGLRYVRTSKYRVTAGDMGAMFTSELLALGVAGSLVPSHASDEVTMGMLTAGYAVGVLAGDRLLVRPFDHTESDARLLALGTGAGALMGLAVPTLAGSGDGRVAAISATLGGILGAVLTEGLVAPARAEMGDTDATTRRTGIAPRPPRIDVQFNPQALALAGTGVRGRHSVLSLRF